ncbi:hypothetical protein [Pseudomonas frederiksbergensis]|uniref:hypothetical protein n=1 Tax=Pseudomonas frederiksbergensis TaxID=104087 RepID=UPI003D1FFCF9
MRLKKTPIPYLTKEIIGTDEGCGIFIPANRLLYQFVRDNPSNTDKAQIASKALIIGRSLSASAERRTPSETDPVSGTANFYDLLGQTIGNSMVGELLDMLDQHQELTPVLVGDVVKVHAFLCDAITTITEKDCSSFASKYLHFHRPKLFPMMDSRARTALKWVANEQEWDFAYTTAGKSKNYRIYVDHFLRARKLFQEDLGSSLSLRQMDNILLNRFDLNI